MSSPTASRPKIAFVSRELWPFDGGGGIGRCMWSSAVRLSEAADVTILTTDRHRAEYERLLAAGDPRLPPGVRIAFAPEPAGDARPFVAFAHAWSANAYRALRELYADERLDLVEFSDYHGEAFATVHAKRSGEPALAAATVCVRIQTTLEIARVLDGNAGEELEYRAIVGMERACLRLADAVNWPGGDVLGTYERFYGPDAIGHPNRLAQVFLLPDEDDGTTPAPPPAGGPLRLLYFGRLERRKGVEELVRAVAELEDPAWELTLLGGDTETGPLQGSMRTHLERLAAGDRRIRFHDRVPHAELEAFIAAHHVVVSSSTWECWSNVAREALASNRPLLSTPVGGVIDVVEPGVSGWLTPGIGTEALRAGIAALQQQREEIDAMIAERQPVRFLRAQVAGEDPLEGYLELARRPRPEPAVVPEASSVTALVTICAGDGDPGATFDSLAVQTVPPGEIVAVSEGGRALLASHELDRVDAFDALPPGVRGHGAVVMLGLSAGRGEHILLVPAGTVLAPEFLERALCALAAHPAPGAVTSWGTGRATAAAPMGTAAAWCAPEAVAATAVLAPRAVLAACYPRDARDARAGMHGLALAAQDAGRDLVVVPQPLVLRPRGRRSDPAPVVAEAASRAQSARMRWTAPAVSDAAGRPRDAAER